MANTACSPQGRHMVPMYFQASQIPMKVVLLLIPFFKMKH